MEIDHWKEFEGAWEHPWECPYCGVKLVQRVGSHGSFLGCPNWPVCDYTRNLITISGKRFCKKCNSTGLLPFIKDGKVIPHVHLHCECRIEADSQYHYTPLKPDDYDFPMADSFRAMSYRDCGVQDPGYVPPQPDLEDLEDRINDLEAISAQPGSVPQYYHDRTNQLQNRINRVQNALSGYLDNTKRRIKGRY